MKNNHVVAGLTTARAGVLEALMNQPDPVGIEALAAVLGRHHNTVREQVTWLVDQGLVKRIPQPTSGRGRPPWLYHAHGPRPGDDEYVELAAALAWTIQDNGGDETQEQALAAGRHWGAVLADARGCTAQPTAHEGRLRTVEVLDDLGYEPTPDEEVDQVVLHRCPLLQAAHRFPGVVCTVHVGLVQSVLDANGADPRRAELTPFAAAGECHLRLLAPPSDNPLTPAAVGVL